MMECIPNFSEGRRSDVIASLSDAASSVAGARLLDVSADVDHNRCVLTLAGEREALEEAVYRATVVATQRIDLRVHQGEHPRVGATDVVPFVPLGETPMAEAVESARRLGERVAAELNIPVYFYEDAAGRPERRNLESIRRKGFEELRDAIPGDEERAPDLGPRAVHPSAGAVVIGARCPLIAYNIYLDTSDLAIARAIARTVRHSSGGLRYVKAMGVEIPARGQVQVSMNLTDYRRSAMSTVFRLVCAEAASYGVSVTESEVVGLVPVEALLDAARSALRLRGLRNDQVLELRLMDARG